MLGAIFDKWWSQSESKSYFVFLLILMLFWFYIKLYEYRKMYKTSCAFLLFENFLKKFCDKMDD